MPKKRKKQRKKSGIFNNSLNPKLGIVLLIIGILLIITPFISNTYAKYQQSLLLERYQSSLADKPVLKYDFAKGAPTGFEGVILEIPRLDLEVALLGPPDSFEGYTPLLLKAPVFLRGSVYPGGKGNVAITAHRIDHGNHFHDLDFMKKGDKVYLKSPGLNFEYTVIESKIINETETGIVTDHTDVHKLILLTCEPKDTRQATPLRLAVTAKLEKAQKM